MAIMIHEQSLSVRFGYSILGAEKAIATDGYLLNDEVCAAATPYDHKRRSLAH
jgi:hypothetical protein